MATSRESKSPSNNDADPSGYYDVLTKPGEDNIFCAISLSVMDAFLEDAVLFKNYFNRMFGDEWAVMSDYCRELMHSNAVQLRSHWSIEIHIDTSLHNRRWQGEIELLSDLITKVFKNRILALSSNSNSVADSADSKGNRSNQKHNTIYDDKGIVNKTLLQAVCRLLQIRLMVISDTEFYIGNDADFLIKIVHCGYGRYSAVYRMNNIKNSPLHSLRERTQIIASRPSVGLFTTLNSTLRAQVFSWLSTNNKDDIRFLNNDRDVLKVLNKETSVFMKTPCMQQLETKDLKRPNTLKELCYKLVYEANPVIAKTLLSAQRHRIYKKTEEEKKNNEAEDVKMEHDTKNNKIEITKHESDEKNNNPDDQKDFYEAIILDGKLSSSNTRNLSTLMIANRKNLNSLDIFCVTPLFLAKLFYSENAIKILIANGATIFPESEKSRVFDYFFGWYTLLKYNYKYDENMEQNKTILDALSILTEVINPNQKYESTNFTGSMLEDIISCNLPGLEIAKRMFVAGAKVPVHISIENSNSPRFLIACLLRAAKSTYGSNSLKAIEYYLTLPNGMTLLDKTACLKHVAGISSQMVEIFFSGNKELLSLINDNSGDDNGCTLLHHAAMGCAPDSVAFLINQNGNVLAKNKQGNTVLHFLADSHRFRSIKPFRLEDALYKSAADTWEELRALWNNPTIQKCIKEAGNNHGGNSLLHIAAASDSFDVIAWLKASGLDPNAKNINQESPLHLAVSRIENFKRHYCAPAVAALLEYKEIDINATDGEKHTALTKLIENFFYNEDLKYCVSSCLYTIKTLLNKGAKYDSRFILSLFREKLTQIQRNGFDNLLIRLVQAKLIKANDIVPKAPEHQRTLKSMENDYDFPLIHFAMLFKLNNLVEVLLEQKDEELNVYDEKGRSPLLFACALSGEPTRSQKHGTTYKLDIKSEPINSQVMGWIKKLLSNDCIDLSKKGCVRKKDFDCLEVAYARKNTILIDLLKTCLSIRENRSAVKLSDPGDSKDSAHINSKVDDQEIHTEHKYSTENLEKKYNLLLKNIKNYVNDFIIINKNESLMQLVHSTLFSGTPYANEFKSYLDNLNTVFDFSKLTDLKEKTLIFNDKILTSGAKPGYGFPLFQQHLNELTELCQTNAVGKKLQAEV